MLKVVSVGGSGKKGSSWHALHFHTLRKWFMSRCVVSGVPAPFYQHWMGHKGGRNPETYLDDSYFKAELEEHMHEYRKVIPQLTLKTVTAKQQEDLQKEVEDLRNKLAEKAADFERLRNELAERDELIRRSEKEAKMIYAEFQRFKKSEAKRDELTLKLIQKTKDLQSLVEEFLPITFDEAKVGKPISSDHPQGSWEIEDGKVKWVIEFPPKSLKKKRKETPIDHKPQK